MVRRPPAVGFTTARPQGCWLPQPPGWAPHTTEAQGSDPHSVLALYREALRLRRAHPAAAHGTLHWHSPDRAPYLAFRRGELACAVNLGPDPLPLARLGLPGRPVLSSTDLQGSVLPPDAAVWLTAIG